MEIQFKKEQKYTICSLSGDLLGEKDGIEIVTSVAKEIDEGVRVMIVDMSQLRYVNSSGIGVLITLMTKLKNCGGELFILQPTDQIMKLFTITKLDKVFNIHNDLTEIESKI